MDCPNWMAGGRGPLGPQLEAAASVAGGEPCAGRAEAGRREKELLSRSFKTSLSFWNFIKCDQIRACFHFSCWHFSLYTCVFLLLQEDVEFSLPIVYIYYFSSNDFTIFKNWFCSLDSFPSSSLWPLLCLWSKLFSLGQLEVYLYFWDYFVFFFRFLSLVNSHFTPSCVFLCFCSGLFQAYYSRWFLF